MPGWREPSRRSLPNGSPALRAVRRDGRRSPVLRRLVLAAEERDREDHPRKEEEAEEDVERFTAPGKVGVPAGHEHRRRQREDDEREARQTESDLVSGREAR